MKSLDVLCPVTLLALALFVGNEALDAHAASTARSRVVSATAVLKPVIPPPAPTVTANTSATGDVSVRRLVAKPQDDGRDDVREDVRQRLRVAGGATYIGELLSSHDSSLARWPRRRVGELRVWIQPFAPIEHWSPGLPNIVRQAFIEWGMAGVPLNFSFVVDSTAADVHVTWVDRFTESISGKTLWTHDDHWWILNASILLALHHRGGEPLDTAAMHAIALHEVGHLIGLDHTVDSTSIMAPRVRVQRLSEADEATARLLYSLPPGRVGGPR